ncbi:MAG: holo-ACP synthase [Syntrophomonadaceae bacterium]|nr:holo-ACP synthase [Syntrophomonadaceae bacterium]
MVMGIGIDIIEIERVEKALARTARFQQRLFTSKEISECLSKPVPAASFAARFAAKEAVFKALGSGCELGWSSVEVVSGSAGGPEIHLTGQAAQKAVEIGVQEIKVSLTHSRQYAAAVAIAMGISQSPVGVGG